MDALADFYVAKYGQRLVDHLDSETKSWFGYVRLSLLTNPEGELMERYSMGLHGLVTGPLAWDVELLHDAVDGIGYALIFIVHIKT